MERAIRRVGAIGQVRVIGWVRAIGWVRDLAGVGMAWVWIERID